MRRAQVAARRVGRGRVQRRHAVEQVGLINGANMAGVVLIDVGQDVSVFLSVANGACGLYYVGALRVVMARVLLKLLSEGNRGLRDEICCNLNYS